MNEATAYHAVQAYFSARRRRSVRRFEMMKLERERRRREFLRRKECERLMYVVVIAVIVSCNLTTERVVWTLTRSSEWWEDVVYKFHFRTVAGEFSHVERHVPVPM